MLKNLPVLMCFVVASLHSLAQCPSNKGQVDLLASYGFVAADMVAGNPHADAPHRTGTGTASAGIRYFLYNRLSLGINLSSYSEDDFYTSRLPPVVTTSKLTVNTTVFAMEFCYVYTFRKYLELYSILGAGPGFVTTETTTISSGAKSKSTENKLKAHYSPVAIRAGGRLGGFLELGFGYKGFVNLGVSYKFGRPCWWKN